MLHIANPKAHQITTAQLAVDRQVEYGQVADVVRILEMESNGPDILWLERWLLADQLAFVPAGVDLIGFPVRLPRSGWKPDCVAESQMAAFRRSGERVNLARSGKKAS